jgi:hypothetical protein
MHHLDFRCDNGRLCSWQVVLMAVLRAIAIVIIFTFHIHISVLQWKWEWEWKWKLDGIS